MRIGRGLWGWMLSEFPIKLRLGPECDLGMKRNSADE